MSTRQRRALAAQAESSQAEEAVQEATPEVVAPEGAVSGVFLVTCGKADSVDTNDLSICDTIEAAEARAAEFARYNAAVTKDEGETDGAYIYMCLPMKRVRVTGPAPVTTEDWSE